MPLRSARIRPTTAACKPAAQTAADCRRQSGVTTAAPANGGPRVRRAGHPHARAMPRTAWQSSPGAYRCHSYCSRCLSALSLLSAPSPAVGRLVASYPPRAVSGFRPPAIPEPSRVLRLSNTSVWGSWAGGVAWLHVHAHCDVLAQPLFSWPPKGRALMAVTWHDHLLPCACGMAHALDQGSGAACASGLGRSSSRRGCSRAGAPPSAPLLMSGFWSALCALALHHPRA